MSDLIVQVMRGVAPPALVSLAIATLAWRLWRPGEGESLSKARDAGARWATPLALALGYAAGHVFLNGWPPATLDVELKHGLVYVALVAGALGLVEATVGRALLGARALAAIATPTFLLDFMREHHWEPAEGWAWTGALAAGLFVVQLATEPLGRTGSRRTLLACWILAGSLVAGALQISGSVSLAQLAGAWTTCVGVLWFASLRRPNLPLAPGSTPFIVLVLGGAILGGRYVSELTPLGAVLASASLLAPWATRLPGLTGRPRLAALVALLATGALAGGALAWEWTQIPDDPYAAYR